MTIDGVGEDLFSGATFGNSQKELSPLVVSAASQSRIRYCSCMLPVRWTLPIVGALFALALLPWAFNAQDTSQSVRNTHIASLERPEPRQTIVPMGMQRDDGFKSSPNPVPAHDVTGGIPATTPVAASPVVKTPAKRIRHVQRRSRTVAHQRAKQAMAADIFGGQRSRRAPKPDFKFNAIY